MTIYDPISDALGLDSINLDEEPITNYIYEEFNNKIIPWNVGIPDTEESKKSKSKKMKSYWTEERRKQKSKDMIEYNKINGTERYITGTKKRYSNEEFYESFVDKMSRVNKCPEKRKKAGQKIKEKWNDPEYLEKMKNRGGGRKKIVVEIDGVVYASISDAVNNTNLSYHQVRKIAGLVK